ncbi:MAG TPA: hypothetical protein VIQ31_14290 [Phormidium sp.]
MNNEFEAELIDESATCSEVQSADNDIAVQTSEDCSADLTQTFTAHEIADRLGVSIRSVYDYANKLIEIWSWVQETEFRHRGRYTQKALDEMTRLKEARNANEYAASVTQTTGNYTPKGGTLARVEVTATTNTLAAKPLPDISEINIQSVDTSAIRDRTQKMKELDSKLSEALTQLVSKKVDNKLEELDARLDDFMAEIETLAKHQAVQKLANRQGQQQ